MSEKNCYFYSEIVTKTLICDLFARVKGEKNYADFNVESDFSTWIVKKLDFPNFMEK